ncbi:uncharacterized protein LOC110431092 [Sorghum bicolor]|uniref:uncharacterized protein LOC110431092 n=1 Tax=Sorghum bicolor TaxID=4558 RepID=UPI000B42563E|nr:uncharacterized protein LOC110431092 [Sorghum bicolor]|eukprot:XP_021305462.1 uncharacterized protein LOC110431092 [Sorghum bicolor]
MAPRFHVSAPWITAPRSLTAFSHPGAEVLRPKGPSEAAPEAASSSRPPRPRLPPLRASLPPLRAWRCCARPPRSRCPRRRFPAGASLPALPRPRSRCPRRPRAPSPAAAAPAPVARPRRCPGRAPRLPPAGPAGPAAVTGRLCDCPGPGAALLR